MAGTIADVVRVARGWVGRDFRPGAQAQCAEFVRAVFAEARVDVGVAAHPADEHLLPAGTPLGRSYADSFAGDDVGRKIATRSDLLPGDIVLLRNTYGEWKSGVITHVGIYVGDGKIVHRPTAARPVEETPLGAYGDLFVEGRRVATAAEPDQTLATIELWQHGGKIGIKLPDGSMHDVVGVKADGAPWGGSSILIRYRSDPRT